MSVAAVIVAAGSGIRAGGALPKQYQLIGGKPVVRRALEAFVFHPRISRVLAVIGEDQLEMFQQAARGLGIETVFGGSTRQESCHRGVAALRGKPPRVVLIHDAARPLVPPSLIDRVIDGLQTTLAPGVIPGLRIADTLKRAPMGRVESTVDRNGLWAVQTPQAFLFEAISDAHEKAAASGLDTFTDDASVAEWAGHAVAIVDGTPENRKLTTARDIEEADLACTARAYAQLPDVRTGQGIDFHAFEPGDGVILCGVNIPHDRKLRGHSDADVALHALADALLGAIGESDIGTHFPPTDPQWKGAPSRIFVQKACELISRRGGRIAHVDMTILAEAPRIGPHVAAMRQQLCELLDVSADRIAIKATTTERMGFIGRGEGLAAMAVATVRLPA